LDLETAQAAIRAAERRANAESLRLGRSLDGLTTRLALAELDVTAARSELAAAEARLGELLAEPLGAEMRREQQRAALLLEEANAARLAALPRVTLTAPFDGAVTSVDVTAGQFVDARATAVRLTDPAGLSIVANASEFEVNSLRKDLTVDVTFPGVGNDAARGFIDTISPAATVVGDKILFPATVTLATIPPSIRAGMSAAVSVPVRNAPDVLYVPTSAIRTIGGQSLVTRVDSGGLVEETRVQLGETFGSNVEVLSGLSDGDVVAVMAPTPSNNAPPVVRR
jgi:membrane fusion protein (multidrug efflux system)